MKPCQIPTNHSPQSHIWELNIWGIIAKGIQAFSIKACFQILEVFPFQGNFWGAEATEPDLLWAAKDRYRQQKLDVKNETGVSF